MSFQSDIYGAERIKYRERKEKKMLKTKFGIEIEFTGITRKKAAKVVANYFGRQSDHVGTYYDTYEILQSDGRKWKVMSDASINCQKKVNGQFQSAGRLYSVELVSPILTYEQDIENLQSLVRLLRKAGGFTNNTCGIHIHLDGSNHCVRSIRNFINIIASKNDLFYKALEIKPERIVYCKKMDQKLIEKIRKRKPKTIGEIAEIWYEGFYGSRERHYHASRYHFLNLHSYFTGNHTIELRGFNSELHAGKIRSYIVLALALNHQALTQFSACSKKPQEENEKFAMRTYLNRIGLIGDSYKNCRKHLTSALKGSSAWRHGSQFAN